MNEPRSANVGRTGSLPSQLRVRSACLGLGCLQGCFALKFPRALLGALHRGGLAGCDRQQQTTEQACILHEVLLVGPTVIGVATAPEGMRSHRAGNKLHSEYRRS